MMAIRSSVNQTWFVNREQLILSLAKLPLANQKTNCVRKFILSSPSYFAHRWFANQNTKTGELIVIRPIKPVHPILRAINKTRQTVRIITNNA